MPNRRLQCSGWFVRGFGLDFERKRRFNKAEVLFDYMSNFDLKYKDLAQRTYSKRMSETVIFGGYTGCINECVSVLDNQNIEKLKLGRYQIEKELGKGAMGVVHLGRDPEISRVAAIKAMVLSNWWRDCWCVKKMCGQGCKV